MLKEFIAWNKKHWNDPAIQFMEFEDDDGNKDIRMDIFGSKFFYKKTADGKKIAQKKQIKLPKMVDAELLE